MRLNWFSPLPPARTDIAHFTARLAPALSQRFEVTFWSDEPADGDALPAGATVRRLARGVSLSREARRDIFSGLNIYNLGNDARFHAAIADLARQVPGVVIAHDTRLHHFAFERARRDHPPFASYLALAAELYGDAGEAGAREAIASEGRAIDALAGRMPFIEAYLEGALGAICHSRQGAAELRVRCELPVMTLPLPFGLRAPAERTWAPPWRLVMFGYVNANRRLESVLRALARWREPFRLDIYGTLWDPARIRELIGRGGLEGRVAVRGFVSEAELDAAIAGAHLVFNLRHPTMGEASGGLLRAWALGAPALVTDAGWYADLPDEAVRKIAVDDEVAGILRALTELAFDPDRYARLGRTGRARLAEVHAPERYAATLAKALADVQRLYVRRAGRAMLRRTLAAAPPSRERDALAERACQLIPAVFAPTET